MVTASTVRIVRAFLAIGQAELAKHMSVSSSLVAAVETGAKRITPNSPSASNEPQALRIDY